MGCNSSKGPSTRTFGTLTDATTQTCRVSLAASIGDGAETEAALDESSLGATDDPAAQSEQRILSRICKRPSIHHIVLTGGPCAGKSTVLAALQSKLPQRTGIKVFCVPEAATLLMTGGLTWSDMTAEKVIEYQLALLQTQIALEDNFRRIAAASGLPSLIVSDRGTMDGRAYATDAEFQEILRRGGYSLEMLRDERYDAVVHMVSAAIGAEKHYNYDNPVRYETVEEAKTSDEKLRKMYIGHPQLRVFDNSTTFERKIDRVLDFVCDVIGCKHTYHRVRRFLVTELPPESAIPVEFVRVRVTHTVLNHSSDDKVMMLMKRQQGVATVCYYQCVRRALRSRTSSPHSHSKARAEGPAVAAAVTDSPNGGTTGCSGDSGAEVKPASPRPLGITASALASSSVAAPAAAAAVADDLEDSLANTVSTSKYETVREEHRISAREYMSLLAQRDPTRVDVVKENISFVYGDHYIELAQFQEPRWHVGKAIMYVDCEKDAPTLPPFIRIAEDMTDVNLYSAYRASLPPTPASTRLTADDLASSTQPF